MTISGSAIPLAETFFSVSAVGAKEARRGRAGRAGQRKHAGDVSGAFRRSAAGLMEVKRLNKDRKVSDCSSSLF